ncbi:hypothetical protein H2200_002601 [Cladophialophora chaetospira]|uniref:Uncharacterized protein n=1 Tax=Cladophialophora chaetospira TaxID=386627 RepID=A0AA38XJB0_9EURO|nr:hypothetical protein H2200_002601 [Cladophialophora chaetospira]
MSELKPPWPITSSKRKAIPKPTATAARKRQRVSNGEGTTNARRKSQQTLTQAQWVTTFPPDFDESEMRLLEEERPQSAPPKRRPQRSLKKRVSTLTQMDFFDLGQQNEQGIDDAMIPDAPTLARPPALPQLDGPYDSPRKPRRRKATPAAAEFSTKRKIAAESQEDYKPGTRKRKSEVVEGQANGSAKRKSSRIASKSEIFCDPVRNFDYFAEALGTPVEDVNNETTETPFNYPLEIKDSTEDNNDTLPKLPPTTNKSLFPRTPKRHATIVLSSQSPESLRASTRRTNRRLYETPTKSQRTPLAERSTNVSMQTTPKTNGKRRPTTKPRSPKSKVVILKLPRRTGNRRPARIEDSQNLWSIPSSSPEAFRKAPQAQMNPPARATDDLEIPATSQAQNSSGTPPGSEDSLPSLSELFSAGERREVTSDAPCGPAQEDEAVVVRDFAAVSPERDCTLDSPHFERTKMLQRPPAERVLSPERATEAYGDFADLDFGSPVANDTQFNVQVQHRVSSPLPSERAPKGSGTPADHTSPSTPAHRVPDDAGPQGAETNLPDIERVQSSQSPMPVPRLVSRSSVDPAKQDMSLGEDDIDDFPLPEVVFVHPGSIRRTTSTQVPLNDVSSSSSSPRLRPVRTNTQKSVHPASMPHPSQMSTQEPTQAFLPPSSIPQNGQDELSERHETIKIKDSSSLSVALSQIPGHVGNSHAGHNPGAALEGDDNWEDEDDFDLDPRSLPSQSPLISRSQAQPTRRPLGTVRTSKESQLTTPASTEQLRISPPQQRQSDLENDSGPLHESQLSHLSKHERPVPLPKQDAKKGSPILATQLSGSPPSTSDRPPPLQRKYSPIPGFNNDTQSNFTQNGHVSAAYVHRQREAGLYPMWFVPKPYQVPGFTRR